MPHLDRDGVKIYYDDHGSGPAILLSHGYSATSKMWADQVAAFKDRYRVITWDMRGHGESDSPEDQSLYSEAHTVEDMAALLDALDAIPWAPTCPHGRPVAVPIELAEIERRFGRR